MLHVTKIKPTFNHVLKLWQTVIAVGSTVRDIKVGDKVMIIPDHFAVKKYNKNSVQNDLDNNPVLTYNFPFETIDDEKGEPHDCLYISDNDIRYVFEGEEKEEAIIVPGKPKLIV